MPTTGPGLGNPSQFLAQPRLSQQWALTCPGFLLETLGDRHPSPSLHAQAPRPLLSHLILPQDPSGAGPLGLPAHLGTGLSLLDQAIILAGSSNHCQVLKSDLHPPRCGVGVVVRWGWVLCVPQLVGGGPPSSHTSPQTTPTAPSRLSPDLLLPTLGPQLPLFLVPELEPHSPLAQTPPMAPCESPAGHHRPGRTQSPEHRSKNAPLSQHFPPLGLCMGLTLHQVCPSACLSKP